MTYKEDEILKKGIERINSNTDSFFKVIHLLVPKWFQLLGYLLAISVFWYIAKSTGSNLIYAVTIVSVLLVIMPILGFFDTINYLLFKGKLFSQLVGFILIVLPLFWISLFTVLLVVDFLTYQFG